MRRRSRTCVLERFDDLAKAIFEPDVVSAKDARDVTDALKGVGGPEGRVEFAAEEDGGVRLEWGDSVGPTVHENALVRPLFVQLVIVAVPLVSRLQGELRRTKAELGP